MILTCTSCSANVLARDGTGRPIIMRYDVELEGDYGDIRLQRTVNEPVAVGTEFEFALHEIRYEQSGPDELCHGEPTMNLLEGDLPGIPRPGGTPE